MLSEGFLSLTSSGWNSVFAQERTLERAVSLSVGGLCAFGRRTVSRAIFAAGRQHRDWSAEWKAFRKARKERNLSRQGLAVLEGLRRRLDALGGARRTLLAAVDGSLCNRTIFKAELDRVGLVARCRKDARLCMPAPAGSRRKYAKETFSPEAVRQDESRRWKRTKVYFGGKRRTIRYQEIKGVLWRGGAGRRPLRLLVVAPQPYRNSKRSRLHYRRPAYLLTTDLEASARLLIQARLDRWRIGVNHRDEKDLLGVGEAQVWSPRSLPRQPAFVVASYSLLLLAALKTFGPGRSHEFVPLPKRRRRAKRPSALDLITLPRKEIAEAPEGHDLRRRIRQNIALYAYT